MLRHWILGFCGNKLDLEKVDSELLCIEDFDGKNGGQRNSDGRRLSIRFAPLSFSTMQALGAGTNDRLLALRYEYEGSACFGLNVYEARGQSAHCLSLSPTSTSQFFLVNLQRRPYRSYHAFCRCLMEFFLDIQMIRRSAQMSTVSAFFRISNIEMAMSISFSCELDFFQFAF